MYTDGSKDDNKVGCAAIRAFHKSGLRLPDHVSIFSAEAK